MSDVLGLPDGSLRHATATAPSGLPWQYWYATLLVVLDCVVVFLAVGAGVVLRFGLTGRANVAGVSYTWVASLFGPVWIAMLAVHRAYEPRSLGAGAIEFKRVGQACFRFAAFTAILCYALKVDLARGFVACTMPVGTGLLLGGRYAARRWLHRRRNAGGWSYRVVVLGDRRTSEELVRTLRRQRHVGFDVVGVCVPEGVEDETVSGVPVLGRIPDAVDVAVASAADVVAVTASTGITGQAMRRIGWDLEGTGIELMVAPALTDIAGPRIHVAPVAGLPLLHVDQPDFGGLRLAAKVAMDRTLAGVLLLLLLPLLLLVAVAVRLTGPGPVLYRQERVGQGGRVFRVFKFRSMYADADRHLALLRQRNEADAQGVLFKMRDDPRVTPLGRWLRRYSIDELPQLWNVVRGDMSLVGPRPPLPSEVDRYSRDVRRRLLVLPGLTGLWQVSGRSDLSWEDSVRLDLYYVENWSPALDLLILWKTVFAVLRGQGAY